MTGQYQLPHIVEAAVLALVHLLQTCPFGATVKRVELLGFRLGLAPSAVDEALEELLKNRHIYEVHKRTLVHNEDIAVMVPISYVDDDILTDEQWAELVAVWREHGNAPIRP